MIKHVFLWSVAIVALATIAPVATGCALYVGARTSTVGKLPPASEPSGGPVFVKTP